MKSVQWSQAAKSTFADEINDYVINRARHAAIGKFAERTEAIRKLPDCAMLKTLQNNNYDGWLFLNDQDVIGEVFGQQHGEIFKIFSVAHTQKRRNGFGTKMVEAVLRRIYHELDDIESVWIGEGEDPAMVCICGKAIRGELKIPCDIKVGDKDWKLNIVR